MKTDIPGHLPFEVRKRRKSDDKLKQLAPTDSETQAVYGEIAKLAEELVEHIEYERDVEENGRVCDIWQCSNTLRPLLERIGLLKDNPRPFDE